MSITACPKCGKPLRPGAKFCGSCGHVISTAPPSPIAAQAPPAVQAGPAGGTPAEQGGGPPCPHCGKSLRPGAKFCNNCGKSITPSGPIAAGTPPPPVASNLPPTAVTPQQPPRPALARTPAQKTDAGPVTPPPSTKKPPAPTKRPPRTGLRVGIIVIAITLCAVTAVGAYFAFDRFGPELFGTSTETEESSIAEVTEQPPITVEPTNTEALQPTETPTIQQIAPEATLTSTDTPPAASDTPSVPQYQWEEKFPTKTLDSTRWIVWGTPSPTVQVNDPNYLQLTSFPSLDQGGITSTEEFPFQPGVQISFEASLHPTYNYSMMFYWDPGGYSRKSHTTSSSDNPPREPTSPAPGLPPLPPITNPFPLSAAFPSLITYNGPVQQTIVVGIQLKIEIGKATLSFPGSQPMIIAPLTGKERHQYQLRVISSDNSNEKVKFLLIIDGIERYSGEWNEKPNPGQISFTGHGWLYSVNVNIP